MGYHAGFLDLHRPELPLIDALRQSMKSRPRSLPLGMAFDAVGHALYARVSAPNGYSRSLTEAELIRTNRRQILAAVDAPREIVHVQSGSATQPRPLLDHVEQYVAVEECRPVLEDAVDGLVAAYPRLTVRGIVGDAAFGLGASPHDVGHRLVLLLESTLGRLDPTSARLELARVRGHMEPDDRLLIGMDLAGDHGRLEDVLDGTSEAFAAFTRNALRRANREIGTDFSTSDWRLVVEKQPEKCRVETRYEACRDLTVNGGKAEMGWEFSQGESLIVERAHKPTEGQVAAMALGAGFGISHVWKNAAQGYALFMLVP